MENIVEEVRNSLSQESLQKDILMDPERKENESVIQINSLRVEKDGNQTIQQSQTENNLNQEGIQNYFEREKNDSKITSNSAINNASNTFENENKEKQSSKESKDENSKPLDNTKIKTIMTQVKAIMGIHYMKTDGIPVEILPGFYLGSIGAAFNKKNLEEAKIGHILCCCDGVKEVYPTLFKYKKLSLLDKPTEDITRYFEEASEYIHDILSRGEKMLVHCFAGKSRSTTIMISYLIKYHKMSVDQALELIRGKRPVIQPNAGFVKQLREYEKKISGIQVEKEAQ